MKRDLYDNFFENTELLGKTLEKRFAGRYKLKKENKEKIGGEFVQLKDSNLARGFSFFFTNIDYVLFPDTLGVFLLYKKRKEGYDYD